MTILGDWVVQAGALEHADVDGAALKRCDGAHVPRTTEVQRASLANEWMKNRGNADQVYGNQTWIAGL